MRVPSSFETPSMLRRSNAFSIAEKGDWDGFRAFLEKQPLPASRKHAGSLFGKLGILPYAISKGAPDDVINRILEIGPKSVRVEDSKHRLPLHIACMCKAASSVVDILIEKYSRATRKRDKTGNVPLHYAVEAACDPDADVDDRLQVIASILAIAPMSTRTMNDNEETPVDMANRLDTRLRTPVYSLVSSVSEALMDGSLMNEFSEEFAGGPSACFSVDMLDIEENDEEKPSIPALRTSSMLKYVFGMK